MTRAEKLWALYTRSIRASDGTLFHDHRKILKRVIQKPGDAQGIAHPTKLTLADALKTWEWVNEKTTQTRDDADSVEVISEISERITALWDLGADDVIFSRYPEGSPAEANAH